ncbi:MAG: redox-sensing transcriptional repressor Rex [Armatimonadota bacterium]
MSNLKKLSRASVVRLELYLEVLEQLQKDGRTHVTSAEIGEYAGLAPVKIRQDLFGLGTDGKPRVGYDVSDLARLIRNAFDMDRTKSACLVGFGNLGRALAGSIIWSKAGFRLAAVFDRDPDVIGLEALDNVRVKSINEIFGVIKSEEIETGIITVPASAAQDTANHLVNAGVRSIWNFAPVKISAPENIVVENQSLAWGLITLSYRMKLAT